ncbi:MAG: glycosyltransferase family 2 protein [Planctomycetes bacterium]|nr:glycosyltransferase family 2 protein [Planctomycetota bacterium]
MSPLIRPDAADRPTTSIVIPTWNGGALFQGVLDAIGAQETSFPFDLTVIDSGSRDGTLERIAATPARLLHVAQREFNHGATRTHAALQTEGEILVFLTQDAEPADASWLANLVAPFEDPRVAGVYARVLPRPNASPLVERKVMADLVYSEVRQVKGVENVEAWRALPPFERRVRGHFNNVCSAVRASVFRELPFRKIEFGEDLDWGLRALEAGHRIVYEPAARVLHSHPTNLREDHARYCADAKLMLDLLGFVNRTSLWASIKAAGGETLKDWKFILGNRRPWQLLTYGLFAPVVRLNQTLGQLKGSRRAVRELESRDGS